MDSYDELYKLFLKINVLYGSYQEINENIKKNQLYHFNDFKIRNEVISGIGSFQEDLKKSEFNEKIDINSDTKTLEFKKLCLNELNLDYLDLTHFNIIRFKNIELKKDSNNVGGDLILKEKNIKEISFESCIIQGNIILNELQNCKKIELEKYNSINNLYLINSNISEFSISQDHTQIEKLEISEKSKISKFYTHDIDKRKLNYIKEFNIKNSTIDSFELEFLSLGKLNIIESIFTEEVNFLSIQGYNEENKIIVPSINLGKCKFQKRFKISINKLNPFIERNELYKVIIVDCIFLDDIRIGNSNIDSLNIKKIKILENKEMNLGELEVKEIEFSAIRNSGSMRIYNLQPKIENKNNSCYSFNNCNFGNLELQNINFKDFNKAIMFENLVQNCLYSDVEWSNEIKGNEFIVEFESFEPYTSTKIDISKFSKIKFKRPESEKYFQKLYLKYLKQQRSTYRLLKNISKNNNDKPQELEFYKKEMESYQKIINTQYSLDKTINPDKQFIFYPIYLVFSMIRFMFNYVYNYIKFSDKNKKIESLDILTLEFSKINDFGLNWFRPLYILVYLNLFFILIYYLFSVILLIPNFIENFIYLTTYLNIFHIIELINSTPLLISQILFQMFLLLNPLNTFAFVIDKENIHPIWEVFRNLLSIINAILIYQIIVAFRKFSRK